MRHAFPDIVRFMPTLVQIADQFVDSRPILEKNGFRIDGLARDVRFYQVYLPSGWRLSSTMKFGEATIFDRTSKVRFKQHMTGASFAKAMVYLEPVA